MTDARRTSRLRLRALVGALLLQGLSGALGGLALLLWIGVEIAVVGYQAEPPLQLVYGVLGAVIVALAVRPTLRGEP